MKFCYNLNISLNIYSSLRPAKFSVHLADTGTKSLNQYYTFSASETLAVTSLEILEKDSK